MNCGDMIHKRYISVKNSSGISDLKYADTNPSVCMHCCSTLDPVLRMEQKGINPEGVGLVALALAYLTATPGGVLA